MLQLLIVIEHWIFCSTITSTKSDLVDLVVEPEPTALPEPTAVITLMPIVRRAQVRVQVQAAVMKATVWLKVNRTVSC